MKADLAAAQLESVVGATTLVVGDITGQGNLAIAGRVQGDIALDGQVNVLAGGLVLGDIRAKTIQIAGRVQGDVSALIALEVLGSGQVRGSLLAPRVGIEIGAEIQGRIDTGAGKPSRDEPAEPAVRQEVRRAEPTRSEPKQAEPKQTEPKQTERNQTGPRQTDGETRSDGGEVDLTLPPLPRGNLKTELSEDSAAEGEVEGLEGDFDPEWQDEAADELTPAAQDESEDPPRRRRRRRRNRRPEPRDSATSMAPAPMPARTVDPTGLPRIPTFQKGAHGRRRD